MLSPFRKSAVYIMTDSFILGEDVRMRHIESSMSFIHLICMPYNSNVKMKQLKSIHKDIGVSGQENCLVVLELLINCVSLFCQKSRFHKNEHDSLVSWPNEVNEHFLESL